MKKGTPRKKRKERCGKEEERSRNIGTLESRRKEDLPRHWTIQERINQSGEGKIRNKCFIHPEMLTVK